MITFRLRIETAAIVFKCRQINHLTQLLLTLYQLPTYYITLTLFCVNCVASFSKTYYFYLSVRYWLDDQHTIKIIGIVFSCRIFLSFLPLFPQCMYISISGTFIRTASYWSRWGPGTLFYKVNLYKQPREYRQTS